VAFGSGPRRAVDGTAGCGSRREPLIFHPVLLPTVAIAATWLFLLNPVVGAGATMITRLTGRAQGLLEDPATALITVALVAVYKNCGLYMLFFLAGLQAIPARAAGSGPRRRARRSGGSSVTSRGRCSGRSPFTSR
jgi:sn-glycerol 3-phosphate transport system permease protein